MIPRSKNSTFLFKSDDTLNEIKCNSKILNISVCQDNSYFLISTENNLFSIYPFSEILDKTPKKGVLKPKSSKILLEIEELIKYINKNNKVQCRPIFELNPFCEEGTSMAIGINKDIMIGDFNKKELLYEIEHIEKCKCSFIQWEKDDYDLLICAFENKKIKIIKNCDTLYEIIDDDHITSMKTIHYQKYKLLITGYNRKVKIRNFDSIVISNNEFKCYSITNLNASIDIIEYKAPYILFCSKKDKIIYCFVFNDNYWRPEKLFEIDGFKNLEEDQKLINVNFITNEGFIITFTNKIYVYYIKNKRYELIRIKPVQENIFFSSLIFYKTKYYYLYVLKTKIGTVEIDLKEKENHLEYPENNPEENKELINTTINTILNRKNEFHIKKIKDNVIEIEIEDVIIDIKFDTKDLSASMTIVKCDDYKLRGIIEDEFEEFYRNNEESKYNAHLDSLTATLKKLNEIIKSNIGDSINSEIDKIKKESFLECYHYLKNWQEIIKNKTPVNNLFKEEEEYDSYNKIMLSSIKDLIDWDFSYDNINIETAFNYVNNNHNHFSSPSLFQFWRNSEHGDYPFSNALPNKKYRNKRKKSNSTSEVFTAKEETNKLNESFELNANEKNDELYEDKKELSYKLSKETFAIFIDKMNKKINHGDILCLKEILGLINYYIQEIINQKSTNLANFYVLNILEIIKKLESQLYLDFLFICILPISSIIYSEITKEMKRKESKYIKSKLTVKDSTDIRANTENELRAKNYGLLSSSESNDEINDDNEITSDFILKTEETKNNSINNDLYNNYINESKYDNKTFDSSKESNCYVPKKLSKNSIDSSKSYRKMKEYRNMSSLTSANKNDKNLIELFGANFCNGIIDYAIFFSKELELLDNDLNNNNIIDFFVLGNKIYENQSIINQINEIIKKTI